MRNELTWTLFLILPLVMVTSRPVQVENREDGKVDSIAPSAPISDSSEEEVISVSITSSVAVGRARSRPREPPPAPQDDLVAHETASAPPAIATVEATATNATSDEHTSPSLAGANIEFIKQLQSKKETRGTHHLEQIHPFQLQIKNHMTNDSSEPEERDDEKQTLQATDRSEEIHEDIENIPVGRSVALSPSSQNYIQGPSRESERGQGPRLTTVSFNVVHDTPKTIANYEQSKPAQIFPDLQPIYSEPPKVYSQPAQVYSEPAKFYSEPAKVYSEPAKVYSEPAKVYSEPAKVYSEPAKFYSPQASLNLPPQDAPAPTPWQETQTPSSIVAETTVDATPSTTTSVQTPPPEQEIIEHRPEKNYEVDEKDSVLSDGQSHGVQESGPESCRDDSCKVGYVVEGRQYRKYRVEERTSDGFIVGEYGVVRNEDGALRGVRYTADGDASPRLIYDALMKFLQL